MTRTVVHAGKSCIAPTASISKMIMMMISLAGGGGGGGAGGGGGG